MTNIQQQQIRNYNWWCTIHLLPPLWLGMGSGVLFVLFMCFWTHQTGATVSMSLMEVFWTQTHRKCNWSELDHWTFQIFVKYICFSMYFDDLPRCLFVKDLAFNWLSLWGFAQGLGFSATIIGSKNLPNRDHNVGKQMPMMMKMMLTIDPQLRPVIPAVRFEVFEKCGDAKMKAF